MSALFDWRQQTIVMGILNLTPDSFSGDGLLSQADYHEKALEQAEQFVHDGALILDIGGESTRPGAQSVSAEDELERVLPVVTELISKLPGTILSVDTYKAEVAEKVLQVGAQIINDVWGLRADPQMASVIARYSAHVVIMHNRETRDNVEIQQNLGGHYTKTTYVDLIAEVSQELMDSVRIAEAAGIPHDHIILDPGIGFAKTVEQNLFLLNHLDEIAKLGYPLLLGVSRKSFIGYTLDLPPAERLEGSLAANAIGILRGANILRVHDVKQTIRLARMVDAVLKSG